MLKGRLQIRPYKFMGQTRGFQVIGTDPLGRQVRILTRSRASACHIKAKVLRGEQITQVDFYDYQRGNDENTKD